MIARVVSFGEIMLRLKAPGSERLLQNDHLEATFGGAEANVAVSLANYGLDSAYITILPPNRLGDACIARLRSFGVDTGSIVRTGDRLGLYFYESGVNHRPSDIIYDRAGSAFAAAPPDLIDWDQALAGASWLHLTGITPAVSRTAAEMCLNALPAARRLGLTVSCDYNFRSKLWNWGRPAPEVMREIVSQVDIGISNSADILNALGIPLPSGSDEVPSFENDPAFYHDLTGAVLHEFPNLKMQAVTLRASRSPDHYAWAACLDDRTAFYTSRGYEILDLVERLGGGDAFSAGLIFGLTTGQSAQQALEFGAAAACLKHSIPGDFNRVTVSEVEKLLKDASGHGVQR